jgi:hypothetical protein
MSDGERPKTPHPGGVVTTFQILKDYGWIVLLILALLGWGLFIAKSLGYF